MPLKALFLVEIKAAQENQQSDCEYKDADQMCSNCTADQHLCFSYMDSTIPLLLKSENPTF